MFRLYYKVNFISYLQLLHFWMVNWQLDVDVYAEGNPGFFMYEQFCETEDPQVEVMKTQQIPKLKSKYRNVFLFLMTIEGNIYPPAQDPEDEPPFSLHSAVVKHVPFR